VSRIWKVPRQTFPTASQFAPGTLVVKLLFSAAKPGDFLEPDKYALEGAPEWQENINPGNPI